MASHRERLIAKCLLLWLFGLEGIYISKAQFYGHVELYCSFLYLYMVCSVLLMVLFCILLLCCDVILLLCVVGTVATCRQVTSASGMKDVDWATQNCTLGFIVCGRQLPPFALTFAPTMLIFKVTIMRAFTLTFTPFFTPVVKVTFARTVTVVFAHL